jgi:hypothetical protein
MAVYAGIWLDHAKAYIVKLVGGQANMERIDSGAESHRHSLGGARSRSPYGPEDVASEQKFEERRRHHLHRYYQNIIRRCRGVEQMLIFGPGSAKAELQKEIARSKELLGRLVGAETADRMTENQIVAWVKGRFPSD